MHLLLCKLLLVCCSAATGIWAIATEADIEEVVRARMMKICEGLCDSCDPQNYVSGNNTEQIRIYRI